MKGDDQALTHFRRRRQILQSAAAALISIGTRSSAQGAGKPLPVGSLPVTCNLTLPVACVASVTGPNVPTGAAPLFEFQQVQRLARTQGIAHVGQLQAAYMLAPLIMDLADSAIPVKVVSLGHRSGAVIMVRTDSSYKNFKDLRGKRVAIPSRFAVDYLFLRKMLMKEGMTLKDVEVLEMAPPDMPAALYAKAVDTYATGEPLGRQRARRLCEASQHDRDSGRTTSAAS